MMDIIEVKKFKKAFGSKIVHNGISFSLKKGECLGLIGGSGQGKSVLLRSLIGLEKQDSGEIYFEGENITSYKEKQWIQLRKKIAYAFQGGALFDSMTVFDNLAYPLRAHTHWSENEISDIVLARLGEFGLSGNEELFPASLSGGMQKRVGLARAIILDPEVILYDEPTAGLDPYNTRKIEDMILRLKAKGKSSIFVTHDMPAAFEVCDRIAILFQGKIGLIAPIEELKTGTENMIQAFAKGEIK